MRGSRDGDGAACRPGGEDQRLAGADRPTKDPRGARPGGLPSPGIRPPQALRARWCRWPGRPYSATRLRSRCGRERPCPTAPSSPARPSRECDSPFHSPHWGAAQPRPPCWSSWTPAPGSRLPATRAVPALAPPRASPHARAPAPPRGPHCPPHRDRVPSLLPCLPSGVMNGCDPGVLWLKLLPGVPTGS